MTTGPMRRFFHRHSFTLIGWLTNLAVALYLLAMVPIYIRDARKAAREKDNAKAAAHYVIAGCSIVMVGGFLLLWIHVARGNRRVQRARIADMDRFHAAHVSGYNDMIRKLRKDNAPLELIQRVAAERDEFVELHRAFKERF